MEVHWADKTAKELEKEKQPIHLSSGLSMRGLQHIGRLRGELIVDDVIKKILEQKKIKTVHYLIQYDHDPQKEKALEKVFKDSKLVKKYSGMRLCDIPCPDKCCSSWNEHFWKNFGNYFKDFGLEPKLVKTSEIYKKEKFKEIIKKCLTESEKLRVLINKYRKRNPYPKGWIPYNPVCNKCKKITDAEAVSFDLEKFTIKYKCKCGDEGESSLTEGKLNWRVEWPALWKFLHIEFEPYGKDHAAAGGSRESCSLITKEFFKMEPPKGFPYEWVALAKDGEEIGEMTSSGFVGISPREWLEIGEPEVLRYWFIKSKPMKRLVLDLTNIHVLFNEYDEGELVYFGDKKIENETDREHIKRSYELSQIKMPKRALIIPYDFAAMVSQLMDLKSAIKLFKTTGHIKDKISKEDEKRIEKRLNSAKNWVEKYAPEFKIKLIEDPDLSKLDDKQKKSLKELSKELKNKLTEKELYTKFFEISKSNEIESKLFFRGAYLVLLGKPYGPRLAPFILAVGKEKVKKIFDKI
jgi:lysyl-tRNA synthetase class 1